MATRTATIHVGVGHPNDDGLIDPPGVVTWWLSEGSGPIWLHNLDPKGVRTSGWLPRHARSILMDGLITVFISRMDEPSLKRLPINAKPNFSSGGVDLSQIKHDDYANLLRAAQESASDFGGKVIISGFQGSAILNQFDQLAAFDVDVEVLVPVGTRLWNRWKRKTVTTGILSAEAA